MPANVKAQRVAELQVQRLGNALLHADGAGFVVGPAAGHDLVVRRQRGAVGQVELAVHQALGAVFGVVVGR